MNLTPEQSRALDELRTFIENPIPDSPTVAFSGAAGTGKTTLLSHLAKDYPSIVWTATTGKAARRLGEVGVVGTTLHSQLYWPPDVDPESQDPRFVHTRPPPDTIIGIDEASMITPQVWEDLQEWLEAGTKIIFVGDPYQLPPILSRQEEKTYGEFFTVFSEVEGPSLSTVMRSDDDVIWAATQVREQRRLPTETRGGYEFRVRLRRQTVVEEAVSEWFEDEDDHVILAWRNKLRMTANRAIRHVLGRPSTLPSPAEAVLFAKNGQGVLNGEIGVTDGIEDGPKIADVQTHELRLLAGQKVRVSATGRDEPMDGFLPKVSDWGAYRQALYLQAKKDSGNARIKEPVPVTWAHALTAHKAQGSEWRRVTIMLCNWEMDYKPFLKPTKLPNGETMLFAHRWLYTAITRAKTAVTIVVGPDQRR